jgi:hypothetical protein
MILSRVSRIQVWIQASSIAKYLSRKV